MPNISAMPQATGDRQTRPRAAGADSSGASSPPVTARSCACAIGVSWRRSIHSTPIHGSAAATANSDHRPSEICQLLAAITGTASRAGRMVPACRTVM